MRVEGEEAQAFKAVRLDSFLDVNKGELVSADEMTGEVRWRDHVNPGDIKSLNLGAHNIRRCYS